ncbi:hypothetical protein N0B31_21060 [Salinirubellus salinus]|uniref:Uncharacterized protein n=1 Tax=Salinirubellus salinus TaxID=1364945 RepID=A0A9E7U4R3_9EURY|nr:hypothetical protein [Salinirubellus salinus]UWM54600.1 hypothetical protein N0B31_21060 [Salinirubellus salinus]
MRPEVGQTVTLAHAKRMAVGYSVLFLAALAIGAALWVSGAEGLALVVWLFGNGFTAFMGVLTVTWDVFEYLVPEDAGNTRTGRAEGRELRPGIGLSRDTRVALRVMLVLLALTAVATLAFSYALGLL